MTTLVPATEYPKSMTSIRKFSDKRLMFLHERMVQLNKDIMSVPDVILLAQDDLCGIVIRSQYWGRRAYEELARREIPVVQYFMWSNDGTLYENNQVGHKED